MRRRALSALLTGLALVAVAPHAEGALRPRPGVSVQGADISWPNCPKGMGIPSRPTLGLPMPVPQAKFVVLGLTNGPGFTRNPCLPSQVAWAKARHLWLGAYAVTSYPTPAQVRVYGGRGSGAERLFRVGAGEANANIRWMHRAGLRTPLVWVDIEPVSSAPWSRFTARNNAVIDGAVAAYRNAGMRVGFYSYAYGWRQITGGRQLPAYATWVPSGDDRRASALARCGQRSFSGGPVMIGQWTANGRDHNVTCSRHTSLGRMRTVFTPT